MLYGSGYSAFDKIDSATLRAAFNSSNSVSEFLRKLSIKNSNSNGHRTLLKRRATECGLPWDELVTRGRVTSANVLRDCTNRARIPSADLFCEKSRYAGQQAKHRILREGLLPNSCSMCGMSNVWLGQPLVMVMDHINGVNDDHRLENLRLLCPNCNSQTITFSGRNQPRTEKKYPMCPDCLGRMSRGAIRCMACSKKKPRRKKIDWPSVQELVEMLRVNSYRNVAMLLGVSDVAIRTHLRTNGIVDLGGLGAGRRKRLPTPRD